MKENGTGKGWRKRLRLGGMAVFLCAGLFLFFLGSTPAWGTELKIPPLKGKAGQEIRIPLILDRIDNLAGIKLTLRYDKEILTFKEAKKSPVTQSLMHMINDRTPGELIIALAGPRGIKGKKLTLLTLTFAISKGLKEKRTTVIEIPEVRLTQDDLKEIECKVSAGSLMISP